MRNKAYHFILIEDSKLDAFIGQKIIRGLGDRCLSLEVFMDPHEALAYIQTLQKEDLQGKGIQTIILLDIQLPVMNGFEFIEQFEQTIPSQQNKRFIINVLSSSIDENDLLRVRNYSSVHQFLSKPLTRDLVLAMLDGLD